MKKTSIYSIESEVIDLFKSRELSPIDGIQVVSNLFSTMFALMNKTASLEEKKAMLEILFSNIRNDVVSDGVYYRGHD